MSQSPYILPEGNVQIAFSGGRTSAYMLHHILEANGGLPDRCVVSFQNTGREMPQTLDFVNACGMKWGVDIVWLEYRKKKPFFDRVNFSDASREGEPFDQMLDKRKVLPNVNMRFCTTDLKVRTAERYFRSIGWTDWRNAVGIRADEGRRVTEKSKEQQGNTKYRWSRWFPLHEAGVTKHDVALFWRNQSFDLGLENLNGSNLFGNCDGCFCKSEQKLAMLHKIYPARAAWWEAREARFSHRGDYGQFSQKQSRQQLRDFTDRQGDWIFETEGALCQADDGECTG